MINFNFEQDIILENELVLLRPLQQDDVDNLIMISENEPEIWQYSLISAAGKHNLIQYINSAIQARNDKKEYPFIIYDKIKKQYSGSTRFYDIQLFHQYTQLGYTWISKEFQGSYLNKTMKYIMLEFAFDTIGFNRVEFRADNTNEKSKAAMISIGVQ